MRSFVIIFALIALALAAPKKGAKPEDRGRYNEYYGLSNEWDDYWWRNMDKPEAAA